METPGKAAAWTGRVLSVLVTLPFAMGAVMKLTVNPKVIEGMGKMGLPTSLILTIGILEALCVVTYLIPPTAVLGAILLTGFLGGAILTHLRVGEAVPMQVTLGVLAWLALYLRDPRLRRLLPFRKKAD
ncbi:MAG: DoxX family protein [bacterium]